MYSYQKRWISVAAVFAAIVGLAVAQVTAPKNPYNLAEDVDEDYPIIFNIILFLAITLIFALIAISVAIATMDPGRDSLIYRVTSAQRFKKDN